MITDFFEPLVLISKELKPDGMGGFSSSFEEIKEFHGAITTNSSNEMKIAEQNGLKTVYTLSTCKENGLNYNSIIKRKGDGKLFRVTSDYKDSCTPDISKLNFCQMTLEGLQND